MKTIDQYTAELVALLSKARKPLELSPLPAERDMELLVVAKVNWDRSPYAWHSPLDTSGTFERTLIVEIPAGEPVNEEIKRLVEIELSEELRSNEPDLSWGFEVVSVELLSKEQQN